MPFKRGIAELVEGRILAPILRAELMKPSFKAFDIHMEGWSERPWDGWFHPSTHATWGARQLALYLTKPDLIIGEDPSLEKVIAVTQGHFFHALAGQIWLRNKIVTELEIYKEDPEHNRRGHMDARMADEGVEIKTINQKFLLDKIQDAESLKKHKPGYHAQYQDYLDMHDLPSMRFVFIGVFYPYPIVEFVAYRDDKFIAAQRRKYKEAIEMAAEKQLPEACCSVLSAQAKVCEMRLACPIGQNTARAA